MLRWIAGLVILGVAAAAGGWLAADRTCSERCARAVEHSDALRDAGELGEALRHLDGVDASCRCGRFTEGDEPPEYASMRLTLRHLRELRGRAGAEAEVGAPHGPMLKELLQAELAPAPARRR